MKSDREIYRLLELTALKLDGEITEDQLSELNGLLRGDCETQRVYMEGVELLGTLRQGLQKGFARDCHDLGLGGTSHVYDLMRALAENERTAQSVPVEMPEPSKQVRTPVVVKKTEHSVSRLAVWVAALSTAAMVMLMALVWLDPANRPKVFATITDESNAVWAADGLELKAGEQIGNEWINLKEGYLGLEVACGAELVVQAPAIFELESESQLYLHSGRLTSKVPKRAVGFTVRTKNATVVDYGTEFGVAAYEDGHAEAHVFKGEVSLRVGSDPLVFSESVSLKAGSAGEVDPQGKITSGMNARGDYFVHAIPLNKRFSVPGKMIDLSDIVGGGNGFGTGQQDIVIDPGSGALTGEFQYEKRFVGRHFYEVPDLSYVDGVFVPDGGEGPITVSREGHEFINAPDTRGIYYQNISNGFKLEPKADYMLRDMIAGRKYGTESRPAISMHANAGITFDLGALRRAIPGRRMTRFTSLYGVAGQARQRSEQGAGFYVLVDGEVRFKIEGKHKDLQRGQISVELSDEDSFLTLMTADGGDSLANDWCVFALPAIELE